ncbi:MAG: AsnC family transcriptional regulator [Variovorax sp.]|nr:MAG: AsnC family transcriptional regulator [Variovorax sp.]
MNIDKKDRLILEALQTDARKSLAALGKRIGSQPAMSERFRKLESAGVIEGYGARVNLRALGVGLEAIVHIATTTQAAGSSTLPVKASRWLAS